MLRVPLNGTVVGKSFTKRNFNSIKFREGKEGSSQDVMKVFNAYTEQLYKWKNYNKMIADVEGPIANLRDVGMNRWADKLEHSVAVIRGQERGSIYRSIDDWLGGPKLGNKLPWVGENAKPMMIERLMSMVQSGFYKAQLTTPKFAVLQQYQQLQTLYPVVGIKGLVDARKFRMLPEGREILKKYNVASGGLIEDGMKGLTGKLKKFDIANVFEMQNQEVAFLSLYERGTKLGLAPDVAAKYANLRGRIFTQFAYSKADTPGFLRDPIGKAVFMYKRFSVKETGLLRTMAHDGDAVGLSRFVAMRMLTGGTSALDNAMGLQPITSSVRTVLENTIGTTLTNGLEYGIGGLIDIDMSGSIGGDVLPQITDRKGQISGRSINRAFGNFLLSQPAQTLIAAVDEWNNKNLAVNHKGETRGQFTRTLVAAAEKVALPKAVLALSDLMSGDLDKRKANWALDFERDVAHVLRNSLAFRDTDESNIKHEAETMRIMKSTDEDFKQEALNAMIAGDKEAYMKAVDTYSAYFPDVFSDGTEFHLNIVRRYEHAKDLYTKDGNTQVWDTLSRPAKLKYAADMRKRLK